MAIHEQEVFNGKISRCGATFMTKNSKKWHESSQSGERPSVLGRVGGRRSVMMMTANGTRTRARST